jgi:hypothetical protein
MGCRSSGVEHPLGKREASSSILDGSTISYVRSGNNGVSLITSAIIFSSA